MPRREVAGGWREVWRKTWISGGRVVTIAWVVNIVRPWHRGGVTRHSPWLGINVGDMGHRARGWNTVGHHRRGRDIASGRLSNGGGVTDRNLSPGWCVTGHWHRRPGARGRGCVVMRTRGVDGDGRHPGHRASDGGQAGDQRGGGGPDRGRGESPGRRGRRCAVHFTGSASSYLKLTHSLSRILC